MYSIVCSGLACSAGSGSRAGLSIYCILDMDIFYIHFICMGSLCIYYTGLLKCTGLACSAGSESESGAFGKDCLCIARAA